jgi:CheY-like chemotaxis protein
MNEKSNMGGSHYAILLVEDEENDAMLLKMALKRNNILNPLHWVKDGLEAIAYLNGEGVYANHALYPFPEVLIVDLKMPRMSGLELLQWIRDHSHYKVIPTIIMSSSRQDSDIDRAYELGANTYIIKPSSFDELARVVKLTHEYWDASVKPSQYSKKARHKL